MNNLIHEKSNNGVILSFIYVTLFYTAFFTLFFFPALMEGRVLAPGDGYVSYYPAILMPWQLWETGILSGYPLFADPQFFLWYPPRWLFRNYNAFIIFAYVAASSLTFGYIRWRTGSLTAGLIAGVIYGTGSFMIGHLGHASIVHAGAWLPLVVWSVDALAERRTAVRFVIGTFAVALCLLGGHPQIFVYAMILAGGLALRNLWFAYLEDAANALKLATSYVCMVALGVSVCAVQLLPLLEFRELSARSDAWSYGEFVSYSLPLRQISTVFFPYLYGGPVGNPIAYFGVPNQTELATYAGLGTLFITTCGFLARRHRDGALFWLSAGVASILLATAGENHIGPLLYYIPVVNSFRAPARSAMIFTLAISVLAGIAIAYLQRGELKARHIAVAGVTTVALAIGAGMLTLLSEQWLHTLRVAGLAPWNMVETAILPPLIVLAAMICLVCLWKLVDGRRFLSGLMIAMVVVDVGLFGWYYEWRLSPVQRPMSTDLNALRDDLSSSNGRLLAMPDAFVHDALHPIRNVLYGIPSVSGYGPLEPKAYQEVTGINTAGSLSEIPGPSLQRVLGLTHVVFSRRMSGSLQFGSCSEEAPDAVMEFDFPAPIRATAIRVISNMSCSVARPDGDPVLTFDATPEDKGDEVALLAGRHTSEWAHDRPDVLGVIRHARAPVESSFEAGGFSGHVYKADVPLAASGPIEVRRLAIRFFGSHGGILSVQKLELIDAENGTVFPLNPNALKLESYATVRKINEDLSVAKFRTKPAGFAWLVNEVRSAPMEVATQTVRSGAFPDGQPFDPSVVALVEGPTPKLDSIQAGPAGKVTSFSEDGSRLSLRVDALSRSFLFLSRSFHPGWVAYVNGERVPLYRANAAFQGVVVPAGSSNVTLVLESFSLKLGGLISLVSLVIMGAMLLGRSVLSPIRQTLFRRL